jgi:serine/threonine-protein kinase HipA
MVQVLDLFKGSDHPLEDQKSVLKAQIFFWLIGATDGHAKNFSIFLGPGGSYHLTPLYDVLTAQPSFDAGQIERKQMRLAMSVGTKRHYRISDILGRHFIQTGEGAGLPKGIVREAIEEIADIAVRAIQKIEGELPADFPEIIHKAVKTGVTDRLSKVQVV